MSAYSPSTEDFLQAIEIHSTILATRDCTDGMADISHSLAFDFFI
jgi:hypothetical protein